MKYRAFGVQNSVPYCHAPPLRSSKYLPYFQSIPLSSSKHLPYWQSPPLGSPKYGPVTSPPPPPQSQKRTRHPNPTPTSVPLTGMFYGASRSDNWQNDPIQSTVRVGAYCIRPTNGHGRARTPPNKSPCEITGHPHSFPCRGRLIGRMQYAPTLTVKKQKPETWGNTHFLSVRPSVAHCASGGTASVPKRPERRVARTRPEIRVSEAERSDASFSDFSVRSSSFSLGDRSLDLLLPPFLVSRQEKEVGAGGG